ncbi:MAG TPA: ABC transporter permease, partial [Anaerolineaceae bacterium]
GSNASSVAALLSSVQNSATNTEDVQDKENYSAEIAELDQQEKDLAELETQLAEFQSISPDILTRPFTSKVYGISTLAFTPMAFFTPGVIVLLLQHITITVAALSIVRERRAGMMELFRVSPVASGQIMIGKYISYLIFGAFIALVLALLLYYGLQVPMLGSWANFALVAFLVLFASLGIGFFISLVAGTESQAVQFAMIALLLSVFFSGFILDLRYLAGPVRIVSWLLPATYGTVLLQDIMLRGSGLQLALIGGLAAIGVVMFLVSWLLMRRKMATG